MTEQASRAAVTPPTATRVTGIVQAVHLEAAPHAWETSPGVVVQGCAFNGEVPGPTIEATVGDTLAVHFTNHLPEPAGIHWDGLPAHVGTAEEPTPGGTAQPGASLHFLIPLAVAGSFRYHIPATTTSAEGLHGVLIVQHVQSQEPRARAR